MILFVFEGGKAEPTVFDSIGKLFLPNEELCVVKCRHDLPTLYSNIRANGYDLFRSLPFEDNGVILPKDKRLDTLFSQVLLFLIMISKTESVHRRSTIYWTRCWISLMTKLKMGNFTSTIP